jgi:NADH-quinone oxidoreductase subunit M
MFDGLLTATVFLPAAGALGIVAMVRGDGNIRLAAVAITIADFVLAIVVMGSYETSGERFQLIDRVAWISGDTFNAEYFLGVDGLSAPLVLLSAFLGLTAVLASWRVTLRVKEYFVWMLVLQTAVLGVFTSLDLLLFFLFWELELVPMYLLISIWGTGRKEYSAMKFLVYTVSGSAFMLVAIVALFVSSGEGSFNMVQLAENGLVEGLDLVIPASVLFWFFFVAFAVKLPIWPIHTWLPDAHTDAPTAVSMLLAGVLLKMGGYGMIRICLDLFHQSAERFALLLAILAVISILYGAIVTLRQTDLKRLIAYSSVSHMGLVLLGVASVGFGSGLTTVGLTGAAMQMFTHGTIAALLFLLVGIIYERTHTRYIPDLGGLANRMPLVACAFIVAGLASLGLPGLSGFVSELLVFLGGFKVYPWITGFAAFGIVLAAGYILWLVERILFGSTRERFAQIKDADLVDAIPVAMLLGSILVIGVYPKLLTDVFDSGMLPIANLFG